MRGKVPHIVQYQGSKRILAPQILQYMPKKIDRLIEPFSGMAAISIATAYEGRAEEFLINDFYRVTGIDGRKIAAYKFGNPEDAKNTLSKAAGRTVLSKALKQALIEKYGAKCFIYLEEMDEAKLQVDHRIPYEIGGEHDEQDIDYFMLLSPSANRAKSWTCEHCKNWVAKDVNFCMRCFWAYPEDYDHVAGKPEKVIAIIFSGNEIEDYYKLIRLSGESEAQATIKQILHEHLK